MAYIVSIDQSTSGTKGLVWDTDGRLLSRADIPHRQIRSEQGWLSHDPNEIFANTIEAVKQAAAKAGVAPRDIAVVGISNQRETACAWSRRTGEPLCDAVVWQCGRAAEVVNRLTTERTSAHTINRAEVKKITGLNLSPYFSGAKWGWIVENIPDAADALESGDLCCGTVDSWLLYKLTGEHVFKTDYSNASRTQLLDLDTLSWSAPLVHAFGLTPECMPELSASDSFFGETTLGGFLPRPVPIHAALGDSHAALFAQGCHHPFEAKVTYGTGSSLMMNAGTTRPATNGTLDHGVVTSLAWKMNGTVHYVIEGNINYTGAVIKWLVDDVNLIHDVREAGELAQTVNDTNGAYLVPAFTGLGAPWFAENARAALVGMKEGTKKAHIVRAAEECIAYQIRDVALAMNATAGKPLRFLRADGGPTRDAFLMQFQADILGIPLEISALEELSGAGAAYCALIAAGVAERDTLFARRATRVVEPRMNREKADELYEGWKEAVRRLL